MASLRASYGFGLPTFVGGISPFTELDDIGGFGPQHQ
jgi:hypothetical protein